MHYCYILYNKLSSRTYVGYTVHPSRRVRQHNGLIKGGAKYTTRNGGQWEYLAIIASPQFTSRTGLSFEWHLKHPRKQGVDGRIVNLMETIMYNSKFQGYSYYIYVSSLLINTISSTSSISSTFDKLINGDILCLFNTELSTFINDTLTS